MSVLTVATLLLASASLAAAPNEDPFVWAFHSESGGGATQPIDNNKRFTVPGSAKTLVRSQIYNSFDIVDWFPDSHPAMPKSVAHGNKPAMACGFCHLATGAGRPENAPIAGLPAEYIIEQVRQFIDGSRRSALPTHTPTTFMIRSAQGIPTADIEQAAAYFAALPRDAFTVVKEAKTIPAVESVASVFRLKAGGGSELLGRRIVEVVDEFERFELRDPRTPYTAYVPAGSIAQGKKLAAKKISGVGVACAACHGEDFGGVGLIPALAGKSPSYLMRQFVNFKAGARSAPSAELMRQVVKGMTNDDFIALAAYLASLPVPGKADDADKSQPPVDLGGRVQGSLLSYSADSVTLADAGKQTVVAMTRGWTVSTPRQLTTATIMVGDFVASTSQPITDHSGKSTEIRIWESGYERDFGTRATGRNGSVETHGTVSSVTKSAAGVELDVVYPGGSWHLIVPEDMQVTRSVPLDRSLLKPGISVGAIRLKEADGVYRAGRLVLPAAPTKDAPAGANPL